jgi:hypothetical protein
MELNEKEVLVLVVFAAVLHLHKTDLGREENIRANSLRAKRKPLYSHQRQRHKNRPDGFRRGHSLGNRSRQQRQFCGHRFRV